MKRSGLTLIELLVAMSILAIIVLAVAQIFQQSTVAWESGYRRTRTAMVRRLEAGAGQSRPDAAAGCGVV